MILFFYSKYTTSHKVLQIEFNLFTKIYHYILNINDDTPYTN